MSIYRRVRADPADWFSADEVRKAKEYQRPVTIVRIVNGVMSSALLIAILWTGAAVTVNDELGAEAWIPRLLVTVALLIVLDTIIDIPFDAWTTFGHERKWGFSTQTPSGFVGDLFKGLLLNAIITVLLMLPLYALIRGTENWWIYGWLVFLAFTVLFAFLGPVVIMPLFNKFTPLEDAALGEKLRALARSAGLAISDVLVMDASKRTKKDNAFFTGLGKTRRVVLFDNLLTQPEAAISTIVAHELGHWRRRHLARLILFGTVTTFVVFYVTDAVLTWPRALDFAGVESAKDPASLPLLLIAFAGIQLIIRYAGAWHSRALERQADMEALRLTSDPAGFQAAMRELSTKNLSELAPSRLAYLKSDHPPPAERLEMAKHWNREAQNA